MDLGFRRMNKYIKLVSNKSETFPSHIIDTCKGNLDFFIILILFISEGTPESCMNNLALKDCLGYRGEFVNIEWSLKTNSVIVEIFPAMFEKESDEDEFFVMRFDNFKKMVEDWVVLRKKQSLEIYFIIDDYGQIFVQEKLEEE